MISTFEISFESSWSWCFVTVCPAYCFWSVWGIHSYLKVESSGIQEDYMRLAVYIILSRGNFAGKLATLALLLSNGAQIIYAVYNSTHNLLCIFWYARKNDFWKNLCFMIYNIPGFSLTVMRSGWVLSLRGINLHSLDYHSETENTARYRCGRFPPEVRTAIPVDGRFEHIVLSCNATSDHAIIWIEREAEKALGVSKASSIILFPFCFYIALYVGGALDLETSGCICLNNFRLSSSRAQRMDLYLLQLQALPQF